MKKRILVTGGTGYIGSHTVIELIAKGYVPLIIDNLINSKIEVLDRIKQIAGVKPEFIKADLLDRDAIDQIFSKEHFDSVIHFAGLKAVGESVEVPLTYYENNITGTINLLESMQAHDVKEIVFSSSATVYGVQDSPKYVETMRTGIDIPSPYGRTKYMIEEIMKDLCVSDPSFKIATLRYFNPIGNHPSGLIGEDPNGIPNNLMPIIMRVYDGRIKELSIYGDDYDTPDGTCQRDYIHVVDLAKGHIDVVEHMRPGMTIYNLGSGQPTSVKEIITAFESTTHSKLPAHISARRPGDLDKFWADASKIKQELGWQTQLTVADAMRDTLKFLKNEQDHASKES